MPIPIIVEAVRRKELILILYENNQEKKLSRLCGIIEEKNKIPERNYKWLADFFKEDQEKFLKFQE